MILDDKLRRVQEAVLGARRGAFILPLTPFPAFATSLFFKCPPGRGSHHALHGVRPTHFCVGPGAWGTPQQAEKATPFHCLPLPPRFPNFEFEIDSDIFLEIGHTSP